MRKKKKKILKSFDSNYTYLLTHFYFIQAKVGNLESLLTSKDMKIQELKAQVDEQKQEMNHSTSHQSSLGGQLTALRDEKTSLGKDILNANKAKRESEAKLEERNSFIEELQVFTTQ